METKFKQDEQTENEKYWRMLYAERWKENKLIEEYFQILEEMKQQGYNLN